MPAPQRIVGAGNIYSFIAFYDVFGLVTGANVTQPANGSSSGALRIWGIQQAPNAIPQPDVVQVMGDDDVLAEFTFDAAATRSYIVTMAVSDEVLESRLLGTNVQIIANARVYEDDIPSPPDLQCVIWHQRRAKSQDSNKGAPAYEYSLTHSATVRALGTPQFNMREAAEYRLMVSPQLATKGWDGITINSSVHGTDASRRQKGKSDAPIHIQAFTGDGTALTVPLDYTPYSSDVTYTRFLMETGQSTGQMYNIGTAASVSVTNKTATAPVSVPAGRHGLVFYQFAT